MNIKHYTAWLLIAGAGCAMAADGPKIIIHEEPKYESPYDTAKSVKDNKPSTPAIVFNPNRNDTAAVVPMAPIPPVIIEPKAVPAEVITKTVTKPVTIVKKEAPLQIKKEVPAKKEAATIVKKEVAPLGTTNKPEVSVGVEQAKDLPIKSSQLAITTPESMSQTQEHMVIVKESEKIASDSHVSSNNLFDIKIDANKAMEILTIVGKYTLLVLILILTLIAGFISIRHIAKNYNFKRDPAYVNPWFKPSK